MSSVPYNCRHPPPETGSLHAILVANPSTRLYTHPLEWKAEQLDNLSCVFHASASSPSGEVEGDGEGDGDGDGEISDTQGSALSQNSRWDPFLWLAAEVQGCRRKQQRDELMRQFVKEVATTAARLCLQTNSLPFRYNRRTVAEIHLPLVFYSQQAAWAYIDGTWSWDKRYRFHRRRQRSYSYTTQAINRVKNLPLDPLYVAILIALAQRAREVTSPSTSHAPHRVSLFVPEHYSATTTTTTSKVRSPITSLKQYTATITNEYLRKFDDPYHFYNGVLHIYQKSFPIEAPSTIYQAIKDASCTPSPLCPSTVMKKRKALNDINDGANKARQVRIPEKDADRELSRCAPKTPPGVSANSCY